MCLLGKEKAGLRGHGQSSDKNITKERCPPEGKTPYGSKPKYIIGSSGNKYTWSLCRFRKGHTLPEPKETSAVRVLPQLSTSIWQEKICPAVFCYIDLELAGRM